MQTIFTDSATDHTYVSALFPEDLRLTPFVRSARFFDVEPDDDPNYMDYITTGGVAGRGISITNLKNHIGWQAGTDSATIVSYTDTTTVGDRQEVRAASPWLYQGDPIFATAFAVWSNTTNEVLMVFRPERPLLIWGDANNQTSISTDILFSYLTTQDPVTLTSAPVVGDISVSVPVVSWESARAAHVWMDPQRVNFIANSSGEVADWGWRSNDTVTSAVTGGVNRSPRTKCISVTGSQSTKILESLPFPVADHVGDWWSVEAFVAGSGTVKLGLLFWDESKDENYLTLHRSTEFTLSAGSNPDPTNSGNFEQISVLIPNLGENVTEAQFRLEFTGTTSTEQVYVDDVIVEANEARLGYFDGEWDIGQNGDYAWYALDQGAYPHKTYSVWYNNKTNLHKQLFGYTDVDGIFQKGSADRFVPEGVSVIPHYDDIFDTKTQTWYEDIYVPIEDFATKTVVSTPAATVDFPEGVVS